MAVPDRVAGRGIGEGGDSTMSDEATTADQVDQTTGARDWRRLPTFKWLLTAALMVVVGLWLASTIGAYAAELDFETLDHPYALLFSFVGFDAVIPIFPSESLLNTASTLVAQGTSDLEIWRLIVGGRFVPGVRFAVGATMGLTRYSYRRFLFWGSIGSVSWAAFTCVSSYLVGSVIDDRPVVSMLVSVVITTALLAAIYRPLKKGWQDKATSSDPRLSACQKRSARASGRIDLWRFWIAQQV